MKKISITIILTVSFVLLFLQFLQANPPKLLILPVENVSKSIKYHYISDSVTKAISDEIEGKFAFRKIDFLKVRQIAEDNGLVYPDEYYIKSVALQLGLILKQDLVISGYFTDEGSYLLFRIFIQEVKRKILISTINLKVRVNNRMFVELQKISDMVVKQASKMLPNKEKFKKKFYVENQIEYGNVFYFGPAYRLPLSKGMGIIDNNSISFRPDDFEHMVDINIGYRRHYIFTYGLYLYGSVGMFVGKTKKPIASATEKIEIDILGVSFLGGFGYQFYMHRKVYLMPQLGVGFTYGRAILDLSISSGVITEPNTKKYLDQLEMDMYGPFLEPSLILGVNATDVVRVELSTAYCVFFEVGSTSHEMKFGFNIAFGF